MALEYVLVDNKRTPLDRKGRTHRSGKGRTHRSGKGRTHRSAPTATRGCGTKRLRNNAFRPHLRLFLHIYENCTDDMHYYQPADLFFQLRVYIFGIINVTARVMLQASRLPILSPIIARVSADRNKVAVSRRPANGTSHIHTIDETLRTVASATAAGSGTDASGYNTGQYLTVLYRPEHGLECSELGLDCSGHGLDHSGHGLDSSGHGLDYSEHGLDHSGHGLDCSGHGLDCSGHGLDHSGHGLDHSEHGLDRSEHGLDRSDHVLDRTGYGQKGTGLQINRRLPITSVQYRTLQPVLDTAITASPVGMLNGFGRTASSLVII